jgi:hypothetical protein
MTVMENQKAEPALEGDLVELSLDMLGEVAGGLNPQPLPPCHDAFR